MIFDISEVLSPSTSRPYTTPTPDTNNGSEENLSPDPVVIGIGIVIGIFVLAVLVFMLVKFLMEGEFLIRYQYISFSDIKICSFNVKLYLMIHGFILINYRLLLETLQQNTGAYQQC